MDQHAIPRPSAGSAPTRCKCRNWLSRRRTWWHYSVIDRHYSVIHICHCVDSSIKIYGQRMRNEYVRSFQGYPGDKCLDATDALCDNQQSQVD